MHPFEVACGTGHCASHSTARTRRL